ncbi:MAG: GntR family transcriptional regulator [Limnochordales bacterium]|nr:GntR family transcriptional regulator [Limnochordales bacterium]
MAGGWRRIKEEPVHRRLHDELLARIHRGELRPGDRFPSENEIIATYGVSSTTARRALYDLTREGFLVRVRGKGSFVASRWQQRKRLVVGVLFPTRTLDERLLDDYYFGRVLQGIHGTIQQAHGNTLLLSLPATDGSEAGGSIVDSYYKLLENHPELTHLAVLAPLSSQKPGLAWLARRRDETGRGPLTVVAGARWEDVPLPWVDTDNIGAGREVARHLVELGHRRIAGLFGLEEEANALDRAVGFSEELAAHGIETEKVEAGPGKPGRAWIAHRPGERVWSDNFAEEMAKSWLTLPPRERPTAIFAAGQGLAIGVLRAVRQLGLRIPTDLSLVGFDDAISLHWLELFDPPLTTVRQPLIALGRAAGLVLGLGIGFDPATGEGGFATDSDVARVIVEGMVVPAQRQGPRGWLLPNELIVRGSTGPAPQ